jgi:nitrite reductase/ring-hydroxylating ferredoxin subunit
MSTNSFPASTPEAAAPCGRRLDRRAFLHDTALAVTAALAATTLAPEAAFAHAVSAITPLAAVGRTRTYAIPATDGVQVDLADSVVLARWQGVLYAFSMDCPHRGATLRWNAGDQQFFCPKHKARFSTTGAHVSGRQTHALDRFALQRSGGNVVVVLDAVLEEIRDAAAWKSAPIRL